MAESSRKLKTKTVQEKYKILKEIEKGETCASIFRKHGIANQTISNCNLKSKRQKNYVLLDILLP